MVVMVTQGQLIYLPGFIAPYKHKYVLLNDADDRKQAERTCFDIWGIGHWFQDNILVIAKQRYCKQPTWKELEDALTESLGYDIQLKYV